MSLLKTVRYAVSGHVRCGRTLIFCIFGRHEIHQENDDMKLKNKKNGGICLNESSFRETCNCTIVSIIIDVKPHRPNEETTD